MKKVSTKTHEISIDEHGIIYKKVKEGAHLDKEDIAHTEKICLEMAGNKRYLLFVDAMSLHTMTPEAVEELKKNHNIRLAAAIYTRSTGIRILADYLKKQEGDVPIMQFQDKDEAIQWLLEFKKNMQ